MNVLLADDGSEHARAAVALLGDLPLPPKSLITALRVFTPIQSAEHIALQTALDRTQVLLQEKGMQAATELLLGYPSEKVVEYAEQHKPNLIVIGAKGLRATLGILLGGVAQQVVEYACCPVLVVRAPYAGLRRVLLVIDTSECSQRAVKYVGHFPLPSNVEVQVMHVLPPIPQPIVFVEPTISGSEFIPPLRSPVEIEADTARQAEEEKQGQALLARAVKSLKATGLKANSVLRRGDAATEIIEYVKVNQIDLIVAGSRGLSRIRGLLMGSVSRKLVHYSGCSVLIVKSPETRPRL
jgi:nucleotide-binding universal stress UspA family protein